MKSKKAKNKVPKWVQQAMERAISEVRYEGAKLTLPGSAAFNDDTPVIRKATRLYTESWIIPLLEAVRDGDAGLAKMFL
jgi:hypothetical protein